MQGDSLKPQTSVPDQGGGLFFLALYAGLAAASFLVLSVGMNGLWVFFAPGPLAAVWGVGLLAVTFGLAQLKWEPPQVKPLGWVFLASILLILCVASGVLQGFENSADEYAYVFQAKTFLAGRLWNPAPTLGQALAADYTWVKDGKWVGQYPPGWPFILSVFGWSGVPFWSVNAIMAAGLYLLTGQMISAVIDKDSCGRCPDPQGRDALDPLSIKSAAMVLLALSPFTIFNGASFHSHMAAALMAMGAVVCLNRAAQKKEYAWAVAAGLALGGVGLIRYVSAVLIGAPFAIALMRRKQWRLCLAVGAGALPCLLLVLAYHRAITGDPFKPVYWLGGRDVDHLYFDMASIVEGLRITGWRFIELVEWGGPGLVLLWVWGFAVRARTKALEAVDMVFPLFVLAYLFYPFDGANRYGPRYYFEAFPFLILMVRGCRSVVCRRLIALSVVYGLVALPFLGQFYRQIVTERQDLYRQVTVMGLNHAVVLVKDGPGSIWQMEPDDMARNGLSADGAVLYARADKVDAATVQAAFPDRDLWIYSCRDGAGRCQLRKNPAN